MNFGLYGEYDEVSNLVKDGLRSVYRDGLWGFVNEEGIEVIPLCENTGNVSESRVAVKNNGKWGYCDTTGKLIIPYLYDAAGDFSEDRAPVKKDNKFGYIDRFGKEVIPFEYDSAGDFSEDVASVSKGKHLSYIDKEGNEVISNLKHDTAGEFSEGLALVSLNGKFGYINHLGEEVITCKYRPNCDKFYRGLADVNKNGRYILVDRLGNELFGDCRKFYEKLCSNEFLKSLGLDYDIEMGICDLPDEAFGNDAMLEVIKCGYNHELEHSMELCKDEQEIQQVKDYFSWLSDYIKGKAYEEYLKKDQATIKQEQEKMKKIVTPAKTYTNESFKEEVKKELQL